jgi:hypothetical protein
MAKNFDSSGTSLAALVSAVFAFSRSSLLTSSLSLAFASASRSSGVSETGNSAAARVRASSFRNHPTALASAVSASVIQRSVWRL